LSDSGNLQAKKITGNLLLVIITLYMGLRPISPYFGDMVLYNKEITEYQLGKPLTIKKDPLFEVYKYFCATSLTPFFFFFSCSVVYILGLYYGTKKIFKEYWFYCFLALVSSFSFWAYGVNGIRNGVASSLFILAISSRNRIFKWLLLVACIYIHISMLLPVAAYLTMTVFKKLNIQYVFVYWLLCIPVALIAGSFFENLFMSLGIVEDKQITGYFNDFSKTGEGIDLKVGFRWDFLLYSASGVFAGWYFIFKKKINDVFYRQLVGTYLLANAFWILVIQANYSNRFAYLSWFMLAIVIFYPLLKYQLYKQQHKVIGNIMFVYFAFTYLFNVILG
jgi:hypothetical protein